MLPPELSVHLASLVPGEDRLVLAVAVHVAENGRIRGHRLIEGVIRSRARLTYGGVARALGLSDVPPRQPEAEASLPLLRTLYAVSKALRMRRQRRGALDFELPEAKVLLDSRGEPVDVIPSREDTGIKTAYGIIEDLMLLANEVVAADLVRRKVPVIYRVHGPPDPRRVETFAAVAEAFGHPLEEDAASSPKKLQRFLRRIAGTPYEQSLSYLLLRSMQQATYDVANIGHFALATRSYLHFTSPIRRYPDLAVHRIVRMLVRGERIEAEEMRAKLQEQAIQSSRMERRAMMVEREVVNVYRCLLMKDRIGDEFEATITAVTERGLSVTVDRPFVEMRIPIERLGEDEYELDGLGIGLVGRRSGHAYVLGARLLVRLEAVALEHRELIAAPSALPDARRDAGRWRAQTRRADSRASLAPTVHPAPSSSKRRRGGSPSANRKNSRKARSSRLR
jgi:ribonuclease R